MSGKNVLVAGSRRGYLITDEILVREVAAVLDASPPHTGTAGSDRTIDAVNRHPYTLRANAAGKAFLLVLCRLNGVPACVLVDRAARPGVVKRQMTMVTLRFDERLYDEGLVATATLVRGADPVLVLEDVVRMGEGHVEGADALARAAMLYDVVHERHRADPVLQPFRLECARHLRPEMSSARDAWRAYGYPVGSFTLCPLNPGQRDVWIRAERAARPLPSGPKADNFVMVRASDMPDVYLVTASGEDDARTLSVRTLDDSVALKKAAARAAGREFRVPASWDACARRWIFLSAVT